MLGPAVYMKIGTKDGKKRTARRKEVSHVYKYIISVDQSMLIMLFL
jgi:hypothetical protein